MSSAPRWAYERFGRTPFTIVLSVPPGPWFTTWAEQQVVAVEREVAQEDTEDEEEREELLETYFAEDFAKWLEQPANGAGSSGE